MRLPIVCLLCVASLSAAAEIYRYSDAQGKPVFTNQVPEGQRAERIELAPTNRLPSTSPPPVLPAEPVESAEPADSPAATRYRLLELVGLPVDEALRANDGTFSVTVRIEPPLAEGHSLRLLLDGSPHGPAVHGTRLEVRQIDRGSHSLAVQVLAGERAVQQSDAQTFTVQRISINSPARARKISAP